MVTKFLLAAAATAPTVAAVSDPHWKHYTAFKKQFSLAFDDQLEDERRFGIFKENVRVAAELSGRSQSGAEFGVTRFSHLSEEEFRRFYLGYNSTVRAEETEEQKEEASKHEIYIGDKIQPLSPKDAKSVDWRGTKAVTPVKDQGQCGSCWAFSATEAAETGYWLKTGEQSPVLSPQQTVSCDYWWHGDLGCNGGMPTRAYAYMRRAGGVETEADYPYTSGTSGSSGWCHEDDKKRSVQIGDTHIISNSGAAGEPSMLRQIQTSPMSVCVDASTWQHYVGGVVDSSTCKTGVDHCVHLVGYKAEDNYWVVKNSWTEKWGEAGYIRVKTGENACAIGSMTTVVDAGPMPTEGQAGAVDSIYV